MKEFKTYLLWALLAILSPFNLHAEEVEITKLVNPSFEQGTTGWTVNNMKSQTNSDFKQKRGTTYMETWVSRGSRIGDASVSQVVKALPPGRYRLHATGLHIQQRTTGSDQNTTGADQTGVWLHADTYRTPIAADAAYTLDFALVGESNDVTIGAYAQKATGNWFCIDGFELEYISSLDAQAYIDVLTKKIEEARALLEQPMQRSWKEALETETAAAAERLATAETADETTLRNWLSSLQQAIDDANASHARYVNLDEALAYARKVYGWWKDDARKAVNVEKLNTAIETATAQAVNYDLTDEQLSEAPAALNRVVKLVDKRIYESYWAVGTGAALNDEASEWCYQRSLQSKHWILFWDKGYGGVRPSGIDDILVTADQIFEFYADSLRFITIGQGKSKSDSYKMIIRLRSTTEWEATGSGIDDMIGLLTLSQWAYTSRGGQTMAHEIGHCFQYQVHCDNGDQNGWMYEWADSPNGNVFWEMCAQWQAYKFYPRMQFEDNEWLTGTLNGLHKHPLCEELRYNNFFIQDYWADRHGMDIVGRLWNQSRRLEDPFQAYMRLTMTKTPTNDRLALLGDEMWDYAARMTTFDFDHLRELGKSTIGKRAQTAMKQLAGNWWLVKESDCPENFGNNAIRLNAPSQDRTLKAYFVGLPDTTGYRGFRPQFAGWRMGFVALMKDGTRLYGPMGKATKTKPAAEVEFECPAGCTRVWFVVSGAPTYYWTRGWDGTADNDEQWPYRVMFNYTNLQGKPNVMPSGIMDVEADHPRPNDNNVRSISGQIVRHGTLSLDGLPHGVYIVNGKKVLH